MKHTLISGFAAMMTASGHTEGRNLFAHVHEVAME